MLLLVPMPTNMCYADYIPLFLSKFQALYKMPYIKSAYKSGVKFHTCHSQLLNQISEDGNYWNVLDKATEKAVISQSFDSLSEVLFDFTIREVVSIMFDVEKDPNTWTNAVKAYAFGK